MGSGGGGGLATASERVNLAILSAVRFTTFHPVFPGVAAVAPPEPDADDPAAELTLGDVEATITHG